MKALINGQVVDLQFDRATNRYYQTFTADSTTKQVSVISDCEGDTLLKDIQLELGTNASPYVVPEVQTGIISGIFKNLRQINLEMTDQENSDLWSKINISTQGTLEQYHRDHISTEIARTAEGIHSLVSGDGEGSVNSRISQIKDLIEQRVSKEGLSAVIRNSGDNIILAIADKGKDIKTAINLDNSSVRIRGSKLYLDGAAYSEDFTATLAKIIKLDAGSIVTGELDASKARIINLDANSITGLDANFIKAKIEYAIVEWMRGKVISAQNDAMVINLNQANIAFNQNATIDFNSANNALVRRNGTHTAFVHFNNVSSNSDGGVGSLYASIGVTSSGDGINSASSGRFAGARFFRGARGYQHEAAIDRAEIYGDRIMLKDDFYLRRGYSFNITDLNEGELIDMNYLVRAVRALARCWIHLNNVRWDTTDQLFGQAIMDEYNAHMRNL